MSDRREMRRVIGKRFAKPFYTFVHDSEKDTDYMFTYFTKQGVSICWNLL